MIDIFTHLSDPIHESGKSLPLFSSYIISLSDVMQFFCVKVLCKFLHEFIPRCLMFCDVSNGIDFFKFHFPIVCGDIEITLFWGL